MAELRPIPFFWRRKNRGYNETPTLKEDSVYKNQIAAWITDMVLGILTYIVMLVVAKTVKRLWTKFRTRNADPVVA